MRAQTRPELRRESNLSTGAQGLPLLFTVAPAASHRPAPPGCCGAGGRCRAAGRRGPGLGQDERHSGEPKAGTGVLGRHLAVHTGSRRKRGASTRRVGPISRCRAVGRVRGGKRGGLCWPLAAARSGTYMTGRGWRAPGTSARCPSRRSGKAARSACASSACARTRSSMSTARSAEESPGRGARWTSHPRSRLVKRPTFGCWWRPSPMRNRWGPSGRMPSSTSPTPPPRSSRGA